MSSHSDTPAPELAFDPRVPSAARIYDFWLGGKTHYPADREAAERLQQVAPSLPQAARDNRRFLERAVTFAAKTGISQFIDVGTGIPTCPPSLQGDALFYPPVLDVARRYCLGPTVVGIDNDPVVAAHDRALLPRHHLIEADIRDITQVLDHPELVEHIDWEQRVAVLLVAVLHFIPDDHDVHAILDAFGERMARGSLLVISHVCSDDAPPHVVQQIEAVYAGSSSPGRFRTRAEISSFFDGFALLHPRLVPVQQWPTPAEPPSALPVLGGVAMAT
ncbi:SAM-dependent methyltransferase [Actinomadura craniellae]|uniref:SAM-dependent methyltransferase n=1 Tax=Actinomadura craniellae TaxID=2231787 RepID=A0A365H8R3_9ACTN|nr:SAM-dependent methyltransferase [Actinomadura craniellae]RAY15429.1 SAM-dependent methyltransferase [Actinomadura craniellae]